MDKKYRLSVTIITKNEADRITRCLESVKDDIKKQVWKNNEAVVTIHKGHETA